MPLFDIFFSFSCYSEFDFKRTLFDRFNEKCLKCIWIQALPYINISYQWLSHSLHILVFIYDGFQISPLIQIHGIKLNRVSRGNFTICILAWKSFLQKLSKNSFKIHPTKGSLRWKNNCRERKSMSNMTHTCSYELLYYFDLSKAILKYFSAYSGTPCIYRTYVPHKEFFARLTARIPTSN